MSRVESSQPKQEKPSRGFFKKGVKTVGFLVLLPFKLSFRILIFVVLLAGFIVFIRTGISDIPLASAIFYREPKPVHTVLDVAYSEKLLIMRAQEQLQSANGSETQIQISEDELSTLFATSLSETENQPFQSYQLAITESHIEFYGRLERRPHVVVRAHLLPKIRENRLMLDIQKVYIGQISAPSFLIPSSILQAFTPPVLSVILETAHVTDITLSDKSLIVSLSPA